MSRIFCSTSVRCDSPRAKAFSDIAAAGFQDIDLLTIEGWVHSNPSEMAQGSDPVVEAASLGLRVRALNTGVGPQLHDRSPEANKNRTRQTDALVDLMARHGIKTAAIQPRSADPHRPWVEVLADCISSVSEQVDRAREAQIEFGLELHVHSPFENLDQAKRLLEEWPDVPLIYDPSHFVLQGIPLAETAWLMENAVHVHLRDCAKGALQAPFGEGEVDFGWVIGALQDRGYEGGFSLEYLETDAFDALEEALRLRDHLGRLNIL